MSSFGFQVVWPMKPSPHFEIAGEAPWITWYAIATRITTARIDANAQSPYSTPSPIRSPERRVWKRVGRVGGARPGLIGAAIAASLSSAAETRNWLTSFPWVGNNLD